MKTLLFLALFCIAFQSLIAQDHSISVFSSSPITINPAATGTFGNNNLRLHSDFNWNTYSFFSPKVHKNFLSISIDKTLLKGKLGIGGDVSYEFGNDIVKSKGALLSAAYNQGLWNDHVKLSIGMQAGLMQNSIDLDQLISMEPNDPVIARIQDHVLYPDFNLGMLAFRNTDNKIMPWIGLSVSHLFRPDVSYFSEFSTPLSRKLTLQAGTNIPVHTHIVLKPLLLYTKQDIIKTIDLGGIAKYYSGKFSVSVGSIYNMFWYGNSEQHHQSILAEVGYGGFELRLEVVARGKADGQQHNSNGTVGVSWNLEGRKK